MGSWNETCGFTNLPIDDGEKVLVMFIKRVARSEHQNTHALYYPFDLFQPVTPLFRGSHDSYGGVDMSEEDEESLWVAARAGGLERQEVKYHGRIRINDKQWGCPPDSWQWMMREDAYQMLLTLPVESYDGPMTIADVERNRRVRFSDAVTDRSSAFKRLGGSNSYELGKIFSAREMSMPPAYGECLRLLGEEVSKGTTGKEFQVVPRLEATVEPLHVLENLILGMSVTRKMLHPTGGAGSQAWSCDAYERLGQFITKQAEEYRAQWGELEDA
jgi:hypothetical protein